MPDPRSGAPSPSRRSTAAPSERLAETLRLNHDRFAGREARIAVKAAMFGWPTPSFDPDSETRALVRQRVAIEALLAVRAPAPDDLLVKMRIRQEAEDTAYSCRPLRGPVAAPRPTAAPHHLAWSRAGPRGG